MQRLSVVLIVLALGAQAYAACGDPGDECVVNGSFTDPNNGGGCPGSGTGSTGQPSGWTKDAAGTLGRSGNGTVAGPACPRDGDSTFAYWSDGSPNGVLRYYQTFTIPAASGETYKLAGLYAGIGVSAAQPQELRVVAVAGSTIGGTPIASFSYNFSSHIGWVPFSVTGTPPNGTTQVTVYFESETNGWGFNALWLDNISFAREDMCPNAPTVSSAAPDVGIRGTMVQVTLTGTNFSNANGAPTAALVGPQTIAASSVVVDNATQVTATFNLPADAAHELYGIEYTQAGCDPVLLPNSFTVGIQAFANGSFENPDPGNTGCLEDTTNPGVPEFWRAFETNAWGYEDRLNRDGYVHEDTLAALPSCPPPDGNHYATMASNNGAVGSLARAYQTVQVTNGQTYTLSGMFAGSGPGNEVTLRLLNGSPTGDELTEPAVIHSGGGEYDWTFGYVSATATSNIMTIEWQVTRQSGQTNAAHADALVLEVCTAPITVTALSPDVAESTGVVPITITGTGFTGTPLVFVSSAAGSIAATVTNVTPTEIQADVDLTGAPSGRYGVAVKQGGCVASISPGDVEAMLVAGDFINGDFELPDPGQDPCTGQIGGMPTGWSTDAPSGLFRDGQAPNPNDCPSPAGGHYGSMSESAGGTFRSWQTVVVSPGQSYEFSGHFAAPSGVGIFLRLLDGDETGTELASEQVTGSAGNWVEGSVQAVAGASGLMTVVWELQIPGGDPEVDPNVGGHADGLTFGSNCFVPFADADGDGDVDQEDYGVWQLCFTGTIGGIPDVPEYCTCFDREGDDDIDQTDFNAFQNCANTSGPEIPADPACGDAP